MVLKGAVCERAVERKEMGGGLGGSAQRGETLPCCCPSGAQRPAPGQRAHLTFIFREWICMILARASSLGIGNSIFRSRRPERSRAGSRMSTLLVAAIT